VQSGYPAHLRARIGGREKRALGDAFGLRSFGVNLTRLPPGADSSLRHAHRVSDEFVFVLEGEPTLVTDAARRRSRPACARASAAAAGTRTTW
jgi:uncharacterized cupin superfamily protein